MMKQTAIVSGVVAGIMFGAASAAAQTYTVGGLIFADPDDPLSSGVGGVTVTIRGAGFEGSAVSWGAGELVPGLWTIDGVPAGTYTVMPTVNGQCFKHYSQGAEQGLLPVVIVVNDDNRPANESLEFVPATTGGCDDGNACTDSDRCSAGVCQGLPVAHCAPNDVPPDSSDPQAPTPPGDVIEVVVESDDCDLDTDDDSIVDCHDQCPGSNATLQVDAIGCNCAQKTCDDGNACTEDGCSAGVCTHLVISCTDGDACTTDRCVEGTCVNDPRDCDDGDPCTDDFCSAGRCAAVPKCAEGEGCLDGVCQPGQSAPECVADRDCADDLFCNGVESCVAGRCVDGPRPCADDQSCSENLMACGSIGVTGVDSSAPATACGAIGPAVMALMCLTAVALRRRRIGI